MKKILIAMMFCIILLVGSVNAFEFDNVKKYDKEKKEVTVINALGLGNNIAKIKLNSELNQKVPRGYQKVAEFEINNLISYTDFMKNMEFFDVKRGMGKISREYDFKYLTTEEVEVNDYDVICRTLTNSTTGKEYESCERKATGSHIEEKEVWRDWTRKNLNKNEKITIGIWTDVQKGDYVEWIPTMFGVRIEEWATWTASMNTGLISYWNFNEGSGTNLEDNVDGIYNFTNVNSPTWVSGKNESSINYSAGSSSYSKNATSDEELKNILTISAWIYPDGNLLGITDTNVRTIFGIPCESGDTNCLRDSFLYHPNSKKVRWIDGSGDIISQSTDGNPALVENAWNHITLKSSGTNLSLYVNGSLVASGTTEQEYPLNSSGEFWAIGGGHANRYFGGMIDEIGVWNRTLEDSEISDLYNSGNGIFYIEFEPATITLNEPIDYYNTSSTSITFNYSCEDDVQVENMTFYINGTLNRTDTDGVDNWTSVEFSLGFEEGMYEWNVKCVDSDNQETTSSTRYFTVDTTNPVVSGSSNYSNYHVSGENITLNWSINDTNLNNCWYEYEGSNTTVTCSDNGTYIVYGNYSKNSLVLYANDSIGNENSDSVSWDVKVFENNMTYNAETTEGSSETFTLNFTKDSSLTVSNVNLIYNSTSYSSSYSVSDDVIASTTITTPSISASTNISFYWNVTFTDGNTYSSNTNNQSVSTINIDNCSSYTNLIYNFTHYDEETKATLNNGTIEVDLDLYNTVKTSLLINFSQTFENTNPVQICLEDPLLTTVNYSAYATIKYSSNETDTNTSYSVEYYNILNETITNSTVPKNIGLYDLKEDDTTKFKLTFRDDNYNLAENVLVKVSRQYVGDSQFRIVEVPITDDNGQTVMNLVKNDIVYNFIMVDERGTVLATFNNVKAFCQDFTIGECTISLNADPSIDELYDRDETFGISITNLTYVNSTKLVQLSFITDDLTPKTVRMDVFRNNDFGNRSVCSNSITAASATLTCNVSDIINTDQFLFADIYVDGVYFAKETINLNASTLRFEVKNGAFYAFLLILFLICMFMEDRRILLVSLGLGWVTIISLGLVTGKLVGTATTTTGGVWLLVSIVMIFWKLNKEETPG